MVLATMEGYLLVKDAPVRQGKLDAEWPASSCHHHGDAKKMSDDLDQWQTRWCVLHDRHLRVLKTSDMASLGFGTSQEGIDLDSNTRVYVGRQAEHWEIRLSRARKAQQAESSIASSKHWSQDLEYELPRLRSSQSLLTIFPRFQAGLPQNTQTSSRAQDTVTNRGKMQKGFANRLLRRTSGIAGGKRMEEARSSREESAGFKIASEQNVAGSIPILAMRAKDEKTMLSWLSALTSCIHGFSASESQGAVNYGRCQAATDVDVAARGDFVHGSAKAHKWLRSPTQLFHSSSAKLANSCATKPVGTELPEFAQSNGGGTVTNGIGEAPAHQPIKGNKQGDRAESVSATCTQNFRRRSSADVFQKILSQSSSMIFARQESTTLATNDNLLSARDRKKAEVGSLSLDAAVQDHKKAKTMPLKRSSYLRALSAQQRISEATEDVYLSKDGNRGLASKPNCSAKSRSHHKTTSLSYDPAFTAQPSADCIAPHNSPSNITSMTLSSLRVPSSRLRSQTVHASQQKRNTPRYAPHTLSLDSELNREHSVDDNVGRWSPQIRVPTALDNGSHLVGETTVESQASTTSYGSAGQTIGLGLDLGRSRDSITDSRLESLHPAILDDPMSRAEEEQNAPKSRAFTLDGDDAVNQGRPASPVSQKRDWPIHETSGPTRSRSLMKLLDFLDGKGAERDAKKGSRPVVSSQNNAKDLSDGVQDLPRQRPGAAVRRLFSAEWPRKSAGATEFTVNEKVEEIDVIDERANLSSTPVHPLRTLSRAKSTMYGHLKASPSMPLALSSSHNQVLPEASVKDSKRQAQKAPSTLQSRFGFGGRLARRSSASGIEEVPVTGRAAADASQESKSSPGVEKEIEIAHSNHFVAERILPPNEIIATIDRMRNESSRLGLREESESRPESRNVSRATSTRRVRACTSPSLAPASLGIERSTSMATLQTVDKLSSQTFDASPSLYMGSPMARVSSVGSYTSVSPDIDSRNSPRFSQQALLPMLAKPRPKDRSLPVPRRAVKKSIATSTPCNGDAANQLGTAREDNLTSRDGARHVGCNVSRPRSSQSPIPVVHIVPSESDNCCAKNGLDRENRLDKNGITPALISPLSKVSFGASEPSGDSQQRRAKTSLQSLASNPERERSRRPLGERVSN